VEKRENPIVNRLNKTKVEKYPDLREEKEARLKELGRRDRDAQQARVSVFVLSFLSMLLLPPRQMLCLCQLPTDFSDSARKKLA
jgi:hypothetical protein